MLKYILFFMLFGGVCLHNSSAQLVTKKDYTAAFGLQAGAGLSAIPAGAVKSLSVNPTAGLKMTFPFNRKWFIGSEINYNPLKTTNRITNALMPEEKIRIELNIQQITVPLYIKYMLRSNRASVLLGGYISYLYDKKCKLPGLSPAAAETIVNIGEWDGGIVFGFEQQLIKRMNLTLKLSSSVKSIVNTPLTDKKFIPLQAGLTLSYDLFRIGDCGCD